MPAPPARQLAVLTCMDARIFPHDLFDLGVGDAHVIRNAGGIVTEDVLRSLRLSQTALGTRSVYVVQHTDCGVRSDAQTDAAIREAVQAVREDAELPHRDDVRGFVLDLAGDGALRELDL